jgi:hypothetical protein
MMLVSFFTLRSILRAMATIDTVPDYLLGGGSHLAKISAVLDWLEKSDAADNELVVMMDAYGRSL